MSDGKKVICRICGHMEYFHEGNEWKCSECGELQPMGMSEIEKWVAKAINKLTEAGK